MKSYNGFSGAQRAKAGRWIRAEIAAGRRSKPTKCCACGQTKGIIHNHQEDYSEPFGDHLFQTPLCYACHMMLHCRFRNREAWRRYRDLVSSGHRFKPFYSPNFHRFVEMFLNQVPEPAESGLPTSTVLMGIDPG